MHQLIEQSRIKKEEERQMNLGKNIRKFRKNTRAISPVIATLLMIAIAVVASLVTYAWVMGYMNFQTSKTGKAIQIQSVSNTTTTSATTSYLTIYVQNVGDSPVVFNDQSVFIEGAQAPPRPSPTTLGTAGITVAAGSTLPLNVTYCPSTTAVPVSFTVDIKVTTSDGTFSTVTKTFP
jgi:archaeal type IV pilus assembly protein PilA